MLTWKYLVTHLMKFALVEECKKRNLTTKGSSVDLAKRLADYLAKTGEGLTLYWETEENDGLRGKDGTTMGLDDESQCNHDDDEAKDDEQQSATNEEGKHDGSGLYDDDLFNYDVPKSVKRTQQSQSAKAATMGRMSKKMQLSDENDEYDDDDLISSKPNVKKNLETMQKVDVSYFLDIEGSLEKFTGGESQDIKLWLSDFEDYADMAGWTSKMRIIACRKMLDGTAKKFIYAERFVTSWSEFKKMLIAEFGWKVSAAEIHRKLSNRAKKEDESYLDYVYEMQRIARMGDFDENAVCEYICDGVPGDAMDKVILYEAESIQDLKKKLQRFEKQLEEKQKNEEKLSCDEDFEEIEKEGEVFEEFGFAEEVCSVGGNDEELRSDDEEKEESYVNAIHVEEIKANVCNEKDESSETQKEFEDEQDEKSTEEGSELNLCVTDSEVYKTKNCEYSRRKPFEQIFTKELKVNEEGPRTLYIDYREVNTKIKKK